MKKNYVTTVHAHVNGPMEVDHVRPHKAIANDQISPRIDDLEALGRLRVSDLMDRLKIGRSTLYARLASGALPRPDGHDGDRPYWNISTVRKLLSNDGDL